MEIVNAISKVRFTSAKPQRAQLHKQRGLQVELLCMEPGQKVQAKCGQWTYYVITGKATVTAGKDKSAVPTGQLAAGAPDETHTIANTGEQRLVCLAIERQ